MASLEEKLALSKKMTHMENVAPQIQQQQPQYTFNDPRQKVKPYNAKEDLKRLQGGLPSDLSNCKLPQSIIESIINNPLNGLSANTEMDNFTENLSESLGIKQSANIIEQLDKLDNVEKTQQFQETNIDYELIKSIIENVVDKKLSSMQQTLLTEHKTYQQNNVKTMVFGDKFLFCDSDDNVYECEMKYKGKRKKK